jgi:hypothetical protein
VFTGTYCESYCSTIVQYTVVCTHISNLSESVGNQRDYKASNQLDSFLVRTPNSDRRNEFNAQQGQNMTSELTQRSAFYIGDPDVICHYLTLNMVCLYHGSCLMHGFTCPTPQWSSVQALIDQYTTNWVLGGALYRTCRE